MVKQPSGKPVKTRGPRKLPASPRIQVGDRFVVTVNLSGQGMANLEEATKTFQHLNTLIPDWVQLPKTKTGLAGWLVNRYATVADLTIRALLLEVMEDVASADGPDEVKKLVEANAVQFANVSDNQGVNTYRALIEGVKSDPFFQSIRHLIRLQGL